MKIFKLVKDNNKGFISCDIYNMLATVPLMVAGMTILFNLTMFKAKLEVSTDEIIKTNTIIAEDTIDTQQLPDNFEEFNKSLEKSK